MEKAKKQAAAVKSSTPKKATRAKKPAAAKVSKTKATAPKRRTQATARSSASTVKKVARKPRATAAKTKVAAKKPAAKKSLVAAKKPSLKKALVKDVAFEAPAMPAVAAPRIVTAAPADFHTPATTVAKLKAAALAKSAPAATAPVATNRLAGAKAPSAAKATAAKGSTRAKAPAVAKQPQKLQRRPVKPATLVVSPADIDTSLAAEVAANMVLNHMVSGPAAGKLERAVTAAFSRANAAAAQAPRRETSTFKHLKESVANPTSHHLDGLFGVIATKKQPRLPFNRYASVPTQHFDKGFGLDVKRTTLPRRKAG